MIKYLIISFTVFITFLTPKINKSLKTIRIFLVGDSIVRGYSPAEFPRAGWGQYLPQKFSKKVQVLNRAVGGRSSKSYIDEGLWKKVLKDIRKGDYVFIQFGHNDQYPYLPKRYTDPDTTYQEYLKKYIFDCKKHGAFPVLITMPIRMTRFTEKFGWQESHIQSQSKMPKGTRVTKTTYHNAMRMVGIETETPVLDLNKISHDKFSKILDFKEIKTYYNCVKSGQTIMYPNGVTDLEHTSHKGASFLASAIISELKRTNSPLVKYLKHEIIKKRADNTARLKNLKSLSLLAGKGSTWVARDNETSIKQNFSKENPMLDFTIKVDHKNDGAGRNAKYLKGWPGIFYNLTNKNINLNEYKFLRFVLRINSNRKKEFGTLLIVSIAGDGSSFDYRIDVGKDSDSWHEIVLPLQDMISMSGYPNEYWVSKGHIRLVISESDYNHGDKLIFSFKAIDLLK